MAEQKITYYENGYVGVSDGKEETFKVGIHLVFTYLGKGEKEGEYKFKELPKAVKAKSKEEAIHIAKEMMAHHPKYK